jgi:hypothetical protein
MFQVALTRIFSFSIWHHFSFMVISIALLGFGVSGVALRLWPALGEPAASKAASYAASFAVTAVLAVAALARAPFDPTRLARAPLEALRLGFYYLALGACFACAGLAVVALLKWRADWSDRLYGSDLLGASVGCALAPVALEALGAEGAVLLAAAASLLAACLMSAGQGGLARPLAMLLGATVLAAASTRGGALLPIPPGPGKGLHGLLDTRSYPEARLSSTAWNAISRVDTVTGSAAIAWTVNRRTGAAPPPSTLIVIDGDAATPVVPWSGDLAQLPFLDHMLSAAGHAAWRPEHALVIGAGGGVDVLAALYHGARRVDAVEVNPVIVELVSGRLAAESGRLFARPGVRLILDEGRSFVRHSRERYDVVQLSLVDTWAASAAGAYSLTEGYLYTVEAFADYLERLSEGGFLTLTRWVWDPPREALKLCSVASAALRRRGVQRPADHIAVVAQGNIANVLVRREPLRPEDVAALAEIAATRGFELLWAPGRSAPPTPFAALLQAPNPAGFAAAYPYDIAPTTDDSPFFFQFGRWRELARVRTAFGEGPLTLSGRLLLLAVLLQAAALSFLFLVIPQLRRGSRTEPGLGRSLGYFACIGLGFMLVEISLMQRFTLLVGHPLLAVAFVLSVLLASAGLGSLWLTRRVPEQRPPTALFACLVALTVVQAFWGKSLLDLTLGRPLALRLLVGALAIAPQGLLLGVPLPAALSRLAARGQREVVGWGWAANGFASVVGPVIAVLIAIDLGFSAAIGTAALAYAAAFLIFDWRVPARP